MTRLQDIDELWNSSKRRAITRITKSASLPGQLLGSSKIDANGNYLPASTTGTGIGSVAGFGSDSSGLVINGQSNTTSFANGGTYILQINNVGKFIRYASIITAGLALPVLVASPVTATGLTAANTNFINFTPPATAGDYKLEWAVDTTTATTDNFTVVITYKNPIGTARSQNSGGFDKNGTALVAGAITNTIGAGNYYGSMVFGIDNSATAITLSTAGTFTTVTYDLTARLYQI